MPAPVTDFFQMVETLDPVARIKIDTTHTTLRLDPGVIIYAEGDPSDAVYIVAAGVVEALTQSPDGTQSRSVAYMRQGTVFGEIGVLTAQPRLATIRSCQETKLFRFDREKFLHLLRTIPEFGDFFSRILAHRLHATSTEAHQAIYEIDLSGNLRCFDLLTVFQAIAAMRHSGELKVANSAREPIGRFFFRQGRVESARFMHLAGLEAVWQGFIQSTAEGSFTFQLREQPALPADGEPILDADPTGLLLEGASRRDAYQALPATLRAFAYQLRRQADSLEWTHPEAAGPPAQIWALLAGRRPQPLATLWRRLNYSGLTFLQSVQALLDTGLAELIPDREP
jgi:CRP-like cAMP-binding protein